MADGGAPVTPISKAGVPFPAGTEADPLFISGGGGGGAVTVADGADVAQGAKADAAWSGSGDGTLIAISKAEYAKLEAILTKLIAAPATEATLALANGKLGTLIQDGIDVPGVASEATLAAASAKLPAALGPQTAAASLSVVPATVSCATVAAGSSTTAFGATGAAGDYLSHVILEPAATNAGTTTIFNNATEVYKYTAGTLADLRPIIIPINMLSSGGAWKVTTGSNMQARGFGTFTA